MPANIASTVPASIASTPASTAASPVSTSPSVVATIASDCAGAGRVEQVEAPFGASGARLASVYLPACYASEPQRRFPVVFLLHGAGADASQWPAIGLATTADDLITSGAIPPMIVVMPDGGATMPDEPGRRSRRSPRAMGGPDLPHARRLGRSRGRRDLTGREGRAPRGRDASRRLLGGRRPQPRGRTERRRNRSPTERAVRSDPPRRRRQGRAQAGCRALREPGQDRGGSADLVEAPGGHNRAYWRSHTSEYLRFYASLLT